MTAPRRESNKALEQEVSPGSKIVFSQETDDGNAFNALEDVPQAGEPPGFYFTNDTYLSTKLESVQSLPLLNMIVHKRKQGRSDDATYSTPESDSYDLEFGERSGPENTAPLSNRRSMFSLNGKDVVSAYDEHLGEGRQYWRDIILGVNDGLVSTFLLVAGVTGAHLSNTDILLTAVAGTIAGAISMAAGEYVATKTQEEVMDGEILLERKHIKSNRDEELEELREAFTKIGIPDDEQNMEATKLQRHLLAYYKHDDEAHLQAHAVLELGVIDDERRNPLVAGTVAFFLFFFGALPSVIPFAVTEDSDAALIAAGVATMTGLFLVGAVKTWATRGSLMVAALENLIIAAGGGGIAYGVGLGFDMLIRGA